ncbi:MAG: CotH kinase family protein [Flavobacteriaceae bacterium]|nr:CotH kinase family protein [Candidatus Onthonaster equi]
MKNIYFLPLLFITPLFGQSLDLPEFSKESGFYDSQFELILSHKDPNATIIYTLDGSEPDINNLDGRTYQYKKRYPQFAGEQPYEFFENTVISNVFQSPILVRNRTADENKIANISTSFKTDPYFPTAPVEKNFTVRAKAYNGDQSSTTVTHVYFFTNQNFTLPIVNLSTEDENLFGYENGLFVAGKKFDEWRLNNPTVDAYDRADANYWASGSESEVKMNFIYIDQQNAVVNQDVGLRINGNGTRLFSNRSHRIYAKSAYGKSSINYKFFQDNKTDKFKRLIFRNSGQDTNNTMFRDAFIHSLNSHLNMQIQNSQPILSFVNGEFYGIYNLRERFDEKYFEEVFDIDEEELDFIENDGLVEAGDNEFYNKMINFFSNNNLSNEEKYQEALKYVDEENVADYHIAEIFAVNFDWPHNNVLMFRKKSDYNPEAKYGQDGRFRWIFKDLDLGFNGDPYLLNDSFTFNSLETAVEVIDYNNSVYTNHVFKGLLQNEAFKKYFINRFSDLLNTSYKPLHIINKIDFFQERLRPEMQRQFDRWNLITNHYDWNHNVGIMKEFANQRPAYQKQHIINFFNLEGTYQLTAKTSNPEEGFVKVNTIEINNSTVGIDGDYSTWSGDYFKNVPVKLQAVALPGYKFVRWEGDYTSTDAELTINPALDYTIKAVFAKNDLSTGDIDKVDFLLYPNPTSDVLNIKSESNSSISYSIKNMLGQNVENGVLTTQVLNVSKLDKGVYLIEINQDNKRVVKKFIKK